MEGTSGSAGLALLRGRVGKAALGLGLVRASDASGIGDPRPSPGEDRAVGSACLRWSLHPARRRSHDERCPSGSGRGSVLTGARKDACDPSDVARYRQVRLRVRPLAGETSASRCQHDGAGPRPRSCADSAARTRCRDGVVGRGFGRACRRRPSAAKVRRGSGSSVREPMPETERAERASARRPWLSYAGRGSGGRRSCSWIDWVAEVDERRSVRVVRPRSGLSSDDGRRPGPTRASSLTRRRRRRIWRSKAMGIGQQCSVRRGPRQRTSETISRARLGANSAHAER